MKPLLEVRDVTMRFGGLVVAVDGHHRRQRR